MIGFFLLFPGPFSLPWDGCWLHGQGLTKATALGKQDKNWSFHIQRPFLPVFEGTFPVLRDAEEGETAAQLPYPLALVPSSAFPGAASSQGFLRESISGQTAVKNNYCCLPCKKDAAESPRLHPHAPAQPFCGAGSTPS